MLKGISEIRTFFRTNQQPIYFIGPTAFNLLGIDRWVRNFTYIVYYDSWDGGHPRVFAPKNQPYVEFESSEQINNYLLRDPEVQAAPATARRDPDGRDGLLRRGDRADLPGARLQPDPAERRAAAAARLQDRDHPARQRGRRPVGAQRPRSRGQLCRADGAGHGSGLGSDLVVQTPYGDSGKTTFFIKAEADWDKDAEDIVGQELKVMKRIRNKAAAVEACITRQGTIVGPFMTDLTGYPELTPYKGGWCGNDLFPEALTSEQRATAISHVRKLGDRLSRKASRVSSRSTCSWTSTPTRSIWVSSTRASPASRR